MNEGFGKRLLALINKMGGVEVVGNMIGKSSRMLYKYVQNRASISLETFELIAKEGRASADYLLWGYGKDDLLGKQLVDALDLGQDHKTLRVNDESMPLSAPKGSLVTYRDGDFEGSGLYVLELCGQLTVRMVVSQIDHLAIKSESEVFDEITVSVEKLPVEGPIYTITKSYK